jgi:hypothetical protein
MDKRGCTTTTSDTLIPRQDDTSKAIQSGCEVGAIPMRTSAYVRARPLNLRDPLGLIPGDHFPTAEDAGVDALDWVYAHYPADIREWAGTVYKTDDGYVATDPARAREDPEQTGVYTSIPSIPPGGRQDIRALYHTHGQCTPGLHGGNDVFSSATKDDPRSDKFLADYYNVPSYLETPGRIVLRYDPNPKAGLEQGTTTQLRPGCSCPNN